MKNLWVDLHHPGQVWRWGKLNVWSECVPIPAVPNDLNFGRFSSVGTLHRTSYELLRIVWDDNAARSAQISYVDSTGWIRAFQLVVSNIRGTLVERVASLLQKILWGCKLKTLLETDYMSEVAFPTSCVLHLAVHSTGAIVARGTATIWLLCDFTDFNRIPSQT